LAFYANKWDMQLSGMRLSGLTCIRDNCVVIFLPIAYQYTGDEQI